MRRASDRIQGEIIACTGQFGAGKSALAAYLATEDAEVLGLPIYANFGLQGARPITAIAELYEIRRAVLVLDELQATVHARNFSKNEEFTLWFDQVRKQELLVYVISQELAKLDVIVRQMIGFEFNSRSLGLDCSEVDVYDLRNINQQKRINQFAWWRSDAFHLYDDLERAWALQGAAMVLHKWSKGQSQYPVAVLNHAYDYLAYTEAKKGPRLSQVMESYERQMGIEVIELEEERGAREAKPSAPRQPVQIKRGGLRM